MKNKFSQIGTVVGKVEQRHVQMALLILTTILFVIGAGAPGIPGGTNGGG